MLSKISSLALLPEDEQTKLLNSLSPEAIAKLNYDWDFNARPSQKEPPGNWNNWLLLSGRGSGKTRVGSETIRKWACGKTPLQKGKVSRIALVAETAADARDVMVLGESGLLACHPKDFRPVYEKTNRLVTWPNGCVAHLYNATEPDQLRGPQHAAAWVDELAKFRYMNETWDQLAFGMRLGTHPKTIITTTPRPLPLIKKLMNDKRTVVTRGSTFENSANLAESFLQDMREKYQGTRLGRQELEAELLEDIPGALWNRDRIDEQRLIAPPSTLEKLYVSVDPAASSHEGSDETGIIVVGFARDNDGFARGYVLEDASLKGSPEQWAQKAVHLYRKWSADKIIAEKNNGGEMVASTIRAVDRSVPVKLVHASRGKAVRAEPVSALYEQGRIHHVGSFDKLEDQMCTFSVDTVRNPSNGSPDRVDALVWGLTEIFDKVTGRARATPQANENLIHVGTDYRTGKAFPSVKYSYQLKSPTSWMA